MLIGREKLLCCRLLGRGRRFGAHGGGEGGAYRGGRPPAVCYALPLIGGGIKRCFCLTSVCLSIAYIRPKSRTERPRKIKIGTEIAHVTRDSDTTFKVKRSWERVGREKLLLRCLLRGRARRFGAHGERRGAGAYRNGFLPTACHKNKTWINHFVDNLTILAICNVIRVMQYVPFYSSVHESTPKPIYMVI